MNNERGFSLVELIVAMTVTLIISSSIYGLLTAGSSAFRREPELADRQQNIRVAMDLIARDVFGAGAAMPTFVQAFTATDPGGGPCAGGLNSCGQPGTMSAAAAVARGAGDDTDTDVLEIVSTDERCPLESVCSPASPTGAAGLHVTREAMPQSQCLQVPGLVLLAGDALFAIQAATAVGGATPCPGLGGAAPPNMNLTLSPALPPWVPAGALGPAYLYRARVVRYRIAPNLDPQDPTLALWRTESGLYQGNGAAALEPDAPGFNPGASPWQLVARGIEDLQIEYLDGVGGWENSPPVSVPGAWGSLVRRVRITLSARTNVAAALPAVRGELATVVTPRAAFQELQMCLTAAPACPAANHLQ